MNNMEDTLIPKVGVISDVRIDTPDIKTFRVLTPDGKKAFDHMPGQCAMLSIPGVGEAMFSITSSPTNEEYMEFSRPYLIEYENSGVGLDFDDIVYFSLYFMGIAIA